MVLLDGRPERLLIEREGDRLEHRAGARLAARVRRIERALSTAFLDVGGEPDAVLSLTGEAKALTEGARIVVEVTAPPRTGKGAVVRLIGQGEGEPRVLRPAPDIIERLSAFAPEAEVTGGPLAREAADLAESEALAVVHPLASGGSIAIEPTRAVVAVDVDLGSAGGEARRAAQRANGEAITTAARLLRLKGLGGPVVFDLAGGGHDGEALRRDAEAAFAPDQPGVVFGPVTRFGLFTLALPRRAEPLVERLCEPDGRPTVETLALRLLRQFEREAGPGQRIEARAEPRVAARAQALSPALAARIGPRFTIMADPIAPLEAPIVRPI